MSRRPYRVPILFLCDPFGHVEGRTLGAIASSVSGLPPSPESLTAFPVFCFHIVVKHNFEEPPGKTP